MSFEQRFYDAVVADSGVSALIGTRMYSDTLPQDATLPALVYRRIATTFLHSQNVVNMDLRQPRVQVDCWSATEAGSLTLAAALIAALGTFNLTDLDSPPTLTARPNIVINQFPFHDRQVEPPVYRQIVEARIWFREEEG